MMLEQFHFLQPLWLLALFPLALLLWLAFSSDSKSGAWEKIIDPRLLPLLLQGEDRNSGRLANFLLATAWIITVIALADPVWEKIPRPVFQTNAARVLVLDLSNSMLIDDLKPNRLSRARFKIEDILSHKEEGQTGLVLFAGDAFTASPLTRDTETIRSFLKVLTPQLMPAQGSRADLGLIQAHELLKQSGINNGQVLLIADGVSRSNAALDAAMDLAKDGHTVSVLGVGTVGGGELRFLNNESVSVKLDADVLRNIATQGGGKYHVITTNNADLQNVLINTIEHKANNEKTQQQEIQNEEWKSTGPLLVLLLLPLAALAFRRGWIFNIFIGFFLAGLVLQPQPVMAFSLENFWQTLSENREQRADNALRQQQFELASELADDPLRRGSAEYKQNKFDDALQSFKRASGADARYNEGNTLAKLKKYKEAIAAYDEALKLEVDMKDALDNKKAIEEMLKKEEEKHKDSENKSESKNQQKDSDMAQQNQQQKSEDQQSKDNKDQKGQQQEQNGSGQQSDNNQQSKSDAQQGEQSQNDQSADQEQQAKDDKTGENQFSEANKAMEEEKDREAENDNTKTGEQHTRGEPKNEAGKTASAENDPSQQANENENNEANKNKKGTIDVAKALTKEEKMAAEQWLRRIPDDPGGLLRRKFKNQYQQRQRNQNNTEQPW
jgi:Ca-activated chloride channel family protein